MEITLDHVEMISVTNGTDSHFPNSQDSHLKLNDIRLPHSYEAFNPKLQKLKETDWLLNIVIAKIFWTVKRKGGKESSPPTSQFDQFVYFSVKHSPLYLECNKNI